MGATSPARRRRALMVILFLLGGLVTGCGSTSASGSQSSTGQSSTGVSSPASPRLLGPERVPLETGPPIAPPTTAPGFPVDGVQCAPVEQLAYHIHSHVQIYVNGQPRSIPGGIGLINPVGYETKYGPWYLASHCYYWLHTHTSDGIVHVESPTARIYTLGDFFDEWGQPLSQTQVATAQGKVTAFVNGRPWTMNPRDIQLLPHAVIQLDVGSPAVPFVPMSWQGVKL